MYKFILIPLLACSLFACSQEVKKTDKDKSRIESVCDKFMDLYLRGEIPKAMEILRNNSVVPSSTIDTFSLQTQQQFNILLSSYGKTIGYEYIKEYKIKDFICRRYYVVKFEKYYIKFNFDLYKNETGWTITRFDYNEELLEIFE